MSTVEEKLASERVEVDAATLGNVALALGVVAHNIAPGPTSAQVEQLNADLDPSRIKKKPGSNNDYLAEHDVVRTANRIFGFGRWGTQVKWLEQCAGGPMKNSKGEEGFYVSYRCCVTLTVAGCVPVDGVGYGDAFEKQWSAQATSHELAVKEAESDAIKRAFKKFGDQFGLILYAKADDKKRIAEQKAHDTFNTPADEKDVAEFKRIAESLGNAAMLDALAAETAEHEHVRAGWIKAALGRARELAALGNPPVAVLEAPQQAETASGDAQPVPNANPAQEPAQAPGTGQAAGTAAAQAVAAGKPLAEGDRPCNDDELAMFVQMASRLGPPGKKKAEDGITAQRELHGGKVSGAWLADQMGQVSAVIKRAQGQLEEKVPEPVTPTQADALTEAFSQ